MNLGGCSSSAELSRALPVRFGKDADYPGKNQARRLTTHSDSPRQAQSRIAQVTSKEKLVKMLTLVTSRFLLRQ